MLTFVRNKCVLVFCIFVVLLMSCFSSIKYAYAVDVNRFDSNAFYPEVSYLVWNDNCRPSFPWLGTGSADIISISGAYYDATDEVFYSNNYAQDNHATNMSVTVRFPNAAYYHDATTGEVILIDLYDTFTPIVTASSDETGRVAWYANGRTGNMMKDGWWITNSPVYKDTYVFKRAGTNENVVIHNLGYTERSMNGGEGFLVKGATHGYVTNDMPSSICGTNSEGEYFISSHIAGTNVQEAHSGDGAWGGFVGCVASTVTPGHTMTNYIGSGVHYASGPILADNYLTGTDASGVVRSVIDGVTYDDTSLWMAAAVTTSSASSVLEVKGFALSFSGSGNLNSGWCDIYTNHFSDMRRSGGMYTEDTPLYHAYTGRWYVPSFMPFTSITPPTPVKSVDKSNVYSNEKITYSVSQGVSKAGETASQGYSYNSLTFSDTLDANVTYNYDLRVYNTDGVDWTSRGTTTYSSGVLTWVASADFLDNLNMNGGNIRFVFSVNATQIPSDYVYKNKTGIKINNLSQTSNEVRTNLILGSFPPLRKYDYDRHSATPQGDGTVQGAIFRARYWFGKTNMTDCLSSSPTRIWTFRTDSSGNILFDDSHLVSGTLYKSGGNVVAPLHGSIIVDEVTPPSGYRLSSSTKFYYLG